MMSEKKTQTMKSATAAQKLGILLEAAPEEFQNSTPTRTELADLTENPPAWLVELREKGPHPRQVVAAKLGVSTSGLARAGVTDPLTTLEIKDLLQKPPAWLVTERATQAEVRAELIRDKDAKAEKAAKKERAARGAAQRAAHRGA
jgi:hypothetical protein